MWVKWKHAGFPPAQRLKADKPLAAAAAAAPALKAPPLKASPVAAAVKSEAPVASAVEAEAMAAGPVDGPAAVKPVGVCCHRRRCLFAQLGPQRRTHGLGP